MVGSWCAGTHSGITVLDGTSRVQSQAVVITLQSISADTNLRLYRGNL